MTEITIWQRLRRSAWLPILALILVNIIIGLIVVKDYGLSWDEGKIYEYGAHSLHNYSRFLSGLGPLDFAKAKLDYYGPAFFIQAELFARFTRLFSESWSVRNAWHFSYFLTFQLAILSLYFLCRRWMSQWAAFGASLLFSTQPLFWGHAFINPKDIPFMAFFLASVAVGFAMVDPHHSDSTEPSGTDDGIFRAAEVRKEWSEVGRTEKRRVMGLLVGLGALLLVATTRLPDILVSTLVASLLGAPKDSWAGRLMGRVAENSAQVPVADYVHKALRITHWAEIGLALLGLAILILALYKVLPRAFHRSYRVIFLSGASRRFDAGSITLIMLAGILLGLCISIRVLGPFAGVLVTIYAFIRLRWRAVVILVPYLLIAALVSYASWPFLWRDPVANFIRSFSIMSEFPFNSQVLFEGKAISAAKLPSYYLPKLILIQLTESVLLLSAMGLVLSLLQITRRKAFEPLGLLLLWFVIPLSAMIFVGSTVYDGFRQVLFIIPPLFVLAGLAMDWSLVRLPNRALRILFLALVMFPGIYSIVKLHPYEYVYYNSLVGGVGGAAGKYELDYWGTTYREAALFVNQVAPPDAGVLVYGPAHLYAPFSRPDIRIFNATRPSNSTATNRPREYQFVVAYSRNDLAQVACPGSRTIKAIEREGAILAAIKQLSPGQAGCP